VQKHVEFFGGFSNNHAAENFFGECASEEFLKISYNDKVVTKLIEVSIF